LIKALSVEAFFNPGLGHIIGPSSLMAPLHKMETHAANRLLSQTLLENPASLQMKTKAIMAITVARQTSLPEQITRMTFF
jgi:hypothetical protein